MNRRRAFTLVELLVVIAIIGILVALLLPAVQAAREAARRVECTNNLSQIIIAIHNYEMAHTVYPPGTIEPKGPINSSPNGYHHSWIVQVLPQMEQQPAFDQIDFGVGVYHANNLRVRSLNLSTFRCPSVSRVDGTSNYAANHHDVEGPIDEDNNGVFFLNSRIGHDDISDGTTMTLFISEKLSVQGTDLGWMSGTNATLRNTGSPFNGAPVASTPWGTYRGRAKNLPGMKEAGVATNENGGEVNGPEAGQINAPTSANLVQTPGLTVGGYGGPHPGVVMVAFGDGHVNGMSSTTAMEVMRRIGHRADGRLLDADFDW